MKTEKGLEKKLEEIQITLIFKLDKNKVAIS